MYVGLGFSAVLSHMILEAGENLGTSSGNCAASCCCTGVCYVTLIVVNDIILK